MKLTTTVFTASKFIGNIDGNDIKSAKVVVLGTTFGDSDNTSSENGMNLKNGVEITTYKADPKAYEQFEKLPLPCRCDIEFDLKGGKVFVTGVFEGTKPVPVSL